MKKVSNTIVWCMVLLFFIVHKTHAHKTVNEEMNPNTIKNWVALHAMTGQKYQDAVNKYHQKGFRLTAVDGYYVNGKIYFTALWNKGNVSGLKARHGLIGSQYQNEATKNHKAGYRLIHIDGYSDGQNARYAAIWQKGSTSGLISKHGLTESQYQKEATKNHKAGYKLEHVSGYGVKGKVFYSAIWKKGDNIQQIARHGLTSKQYQDVVSKYSPLGYRVTQVDGYDVAGKVYYACILEKVNGRYSSRHGMNNKNYQLQVDNHYYQGFMPISVSGHDAGNQGGYSAAFKSVGGWQNSDIAQLDTKIKKVMTDYKIPGLSLAIVKDGKLVFAKGYGYGEKDKKEIAAATSLFRLASVSKPLTSVAIMQLVEQGKLKLSDKVLGNGSILGTKYGSKPYSNREKAVTVGQLLEHTAGGHAWDHNTKPNNSIDKWGAPMFQKKDFRKSKLIGWVLDDRNPSHDPGTIYEYSNFGFCLLGRIIEKKTGMGYEAYLRKQVLRKCGITDMYIGANKKENKRYKEVAYYAGEGTGAYELKMRRMDSHGGWIASSVDLLRFMVRVDGQNSKKDILKANTFKTMTTGSSANSGYAKGWGVNSTATVMSHGGGMSGTTTMLKKIDNSISYAILSNSTDRGKDKSSDKANKQSSAMNKAMEEGIQAVKSWPEIDLF